MRTKGHPRAENEVNSLSNVPWPLSIMDALKRGGTAPGPPEILAGVNSRPSFSSHKYAIQSMGHTLSNPTTKVSHKGSGYKSITDRTPLQSVSRDRNSGRRPQQLRSKHHSMEDIIGFANNEEDLGSRASARDIRPPSRHLTPPKAVGLELPPKPMTPPESDRLYDNTWSNSARLTQNPARELVYSKKMRESNRKNVRSSSQVAKRMKNNTRPSTNETATLANAQEKQRSRARSKQTPQRKTETDSIVNKPGPLSSKIALNTFQNLIPMRESYEKRMRGTVKGIGFS